MRALVLKRLTLVLTALAFLWAGALPSATPAMSMPGTGCCTDCPSKAPVEKHPASLCCTPACAGMVAFRAPSELLPRAFERLIYAPLSAAPTAGEAPAPDPLPPRPSARA